MAAVGLRVDVDNLTYGIYVEGERREKRYKKLLSKVSFNVESGEYCALMGSSGAGKRQEIMFKACSISEFLFKISIL